MGQLAAEVQGWKWATCRVWFLEFALFFSNWGNMTIQWASQLNLQLHGVNTQLGGKVKSHEFCSEKESSEHSSDSSCIFPAKLFFFFFFLKGWTKTHEREIHSLDLGAHELLSSHKTKEINFLPGRNSISSYTVTPSLNLIHRTEENKQTNSKSNSQRKWEEWNWKPSEWFPLCPELLIGLNPEPTT